MIILPLQYFGSVEYWTAIIQGGDQVVIDIGENYVKRSERNRTTILASEGTMQLSVLWVRISSLGPKKHDGFDTKPSCFFYIG